ncbi:MAG: hypothetical protein V1702_03255 [Candidatus Woesearchaeota archaeon]
MKFEQKVANSFSAVKKDIEPFKNSMNDWIIFLDHSQRETKMQLRELERKVRQLEAERRINFDDSYE